MKALVTGATGGLGRNLVERLLRDGHEVIALGRNLEVGKHLTDQGAEFVTMGITSNNTAPYHGVDTVFHCAALSSPWGKFDDFLAVNVNGTQAVINACLTENVRRLVHVSSPSIYFDYTEKHNIKETDPLPIKCANHYATTKAMAEVFIDDAVAKSRLQAVTIRPRAIFGPFDTSIMPRINAASKNGRVPLFNGGKAVVDVTYVENVVESMILAAHAGDHVIGKKYNITNNEPISLADMLERSFKALELPYKPFSVPYSVIKHVASAMELWASLPFVDKEPKLTPYSAAVFAIGQTLDISAAVNDLGYKPLYSIDEGLERYAAWYKAQKA